LTFPGYGLAFFLSAICDFLPKHKLLNREGITSGVYRHANRFAKQSGNSGQYKFKSLKRAQRKPMLLFTFEGELFKFSVNGPAFDPLFQLPPRMKAAPF